MKKSLIIIVILSIFFLPYRTQVAPGLDLKIKYEKYIANKTIKGSYSYSDSIVSDVSDIDFNIKEDGIVKISKIKSWTLLIINILGFVLNKVTKHDLSYSFVYISLFIPNEYTLNPFNHNFSLRESANLSQSKTVSIYEDEKMNVISIIIDSEDKYYKIEYSITNASQYDSFPLVLNLGSKIN